MLAQAAGRGELPEEQRRRALFADVAPAIIHSRVLLSLEPVDDAFAEALVDQILLPIIRSGTSEEHLGTVLVHA